METDPITSAYNTGYDDGFAKGEHVGFAQAMRESLGRENHMLFLGTVFGGALVTVGLLVIRGLSA